MPDRPLPPIVYLPSSGGYTSSRIVPEVRRFRRSSSQVRLFELVLRIQTPDRQRFPFRRYSIDDDGKLVCKTRGVARDTRVSFERPPSPGSKLHLSRAKPYDRPPSKPALNPPRRSLSPPLAGDDSGPSGSDAAAQFLTSLVPTIMRDPTALESSVSSICAAHNVDPTIAASLVRVVRKQLGPPDDETLNER